MLDGRLYRVSLVIPALALLVLAFSLSPPPGPLHSALSPIAFDGGSVASSMRTLQASDPGRTPGSAGDVRLAGAVSRSLAGEGFTVSRDPFTARTRAGVRQLENVVATRAGSATAEGTVVVIAPRDLAGTAGVSGTAMLLALGRVLGGETLDRGVVLASVSGTAGGAGAARLAATLRGPVDAVIVLGDVASRTRAAPILIPWSSGPSIAPVRLRDTLSSALASQAGIHAGAVHVLSQLAHLAFPITLSAQGPFGARGIPAVDLSLSGERGPLVSGPVYGAGRLGQIGEGALSAITALGNGPVMAAPSGDVLFDGEVVPEWAISAFVLALILPVLLVGVDGLARARRRRYPLGRALVTVLASASPFLVAGLVLLIGHALGALLSPAGPVAPGAVPLTGGGIATVVVALLLGLGCGYLVHRSWAWLRAGTGAAERPGRTRAPAHPEDGAVPAILLILCVAAVLLWIADPFAAVLVIPALHLWLWALDPDLPLPAGGWVRGALLALGAIPTAAVVVFYAHSLGAGVGPLAYQAVLLLAGHRVSWVAAVEWSFVLGCLVTGVVLVLSAARRPAPAALPVTVRGPIGYAGPGSLGGTKSALRR